MPIQRFSPPAVSRYIASSATAAVILVAGAFFSITGPKTGLPASGSYLQQYKTGSGYLRGTIDDMGSLAFSGTLSLGRNNAGSGKLILQGADGGKACVMDTDGAGYTVTNECLNGTCTDRIARGSECP